MLRMFPRGMRRLCAPRGSTAASSDALQSLSEEETLIFTTARDFAVREMLPHAAQWDAEATHPVATLQLASTLGFGAITCDDTLGGSGLGRIEASLIYEALSYACPSTTAYISIHNMVASAVDKNGTARQRECVLPLMASMESRGSYCLTEPNAGSDAGSISTRARPVSRSKNPEEAAKISDEARRVADADPCFAFYADEDTNEEHGGDPDCAGFVLNGSKAFISGAGDSSVYLVMARTGTSGPRGITAFLVPRDARGVSFGAKEDKLGWNSQPTRAVTFEDVFVPKSAVLGAENGGFAIAMNALDSGRVSIASCSIGGAQACFDYALDYARERRQFGTRIADFQASGFRLAEMASRVAASRLLVRAAARRVDAAEGRNSANPANPDDPSGISPPRDVKSDGFAGYASAMAKRFATDECFAVANDALQLHGGYGYLRDYPVERYMRDLRVHQILEGTNEIMRVVMARHIIKD